MALRLRAKACQVRAKGVRCSRRPIAAVELAGKRTEVCSPHHLRFRRHGDVFAEIPISRANRSVSSRTRGQNGRIMEAGITTPKTRRERLRAALVGQTIWENEPLPEAGTTDYETTPFCGNFGCICPPLAEMDRLLDRLLEIR